MFYILPSHIHYTIIGILKFYFMGATPDAEVTLCDWKIYSFIFMPNCEILVRYRC